MGLADRDYMRHRQRAQGEHSPHFLRPPEPRSATSLLAMVLVFLTALLMLYKGADWWLNQREAQRQQKQGIPAMAPAAMRPSIPVVRPADVAPRGEQALLSRPAQGFQQESSRTVTKCVLHGKTSYSDGPCPPGAMASGLLIERNANVIDTPRSLAEPPANAAAPVAVARPELSAGHTVNPTVALKAECAALSRYIEQLDAEARQPLHAQRQDWIRQERKQARDRQFAIRC